jgi:membrane protease YdiL (CAAX protease family)
VVCPLVWAAAFALGRSALGLLPAVSTAAIALAVWLIFGEPERLAALLKPRAADLMLGVTAALALVGAGRLAFHLATLRWPQLALAVGDLYAELPARDLAHGALLLTTALLEELIWRGAVQSALATRLGRPVAGAAAATLLYTLGHATCGSWLLVGLAAGCGAFWSALRAYSGSLLPSLVSHLAFDLAFMLLWPLV